ncbi:hypothetical protein JRO89_XS06G0098700 [Xanthoceras sorbifolium]|uniref:Uncharacterized protein n=1 Tax=Xanthoceras sorbifolium TaxID=99658 RepID=A0ABQ8HXJ7_9ROSI|nr:hypothetical protein JRO89_XS06G0098700 [Xanthoceras sorbifolium]
MHNSAMSFRNLLVLLCYMLMISSSLSTDWKHYYDTGNFTANSTYARNRNLLQSSLASNITGYKGSTIPPLAKTLTKFMVSHSVEEMFLQTIVAAVSIPHDKILCLHVLARKKHYCGLGILRALYTMQTALILEKWRWILQYSNNSACDNNILYMHMVLAYADGYIAVGTFVIIVVSVIIFMILVSVACFFLGKQKQKQIRNNPGRKYCKFIVLIFYENCQI